MAKLDCSGEYNIVDQKYKLEIELKKDKNNTYLNLCPTVIIPVYGKCRSRTGIFRARAPIYFIIVILSNAEIMDPRQITNNEAIPYLIDTSDKNNPKLVISGSLTTHGFFPDGKQVGVVVIEETESNFIFTRSAFINEFSIYKKRAIKNPNTNTRFINKNNFVF